MTTDLHRIVYFSRNVIAGSPDEIDQVVRDILAVARRNNARLGFTGALMFNSGCFVQTLEGTQEPLMDLFNRIKSDKRHSAISLLSFQPIAERAFSNWAMAFVGTRESDLVRHGGIAEETGFDPSRMDGEATFEFLRRLALSEEQRSN